MLARDHPSDNGSRCCPTDLLARERALISLVTRLESGRDENSSQDDPAVKDAKITATRQCLTSLRREIRQNPCLEQHHRTLELNNA